MCGIIGYTGSENAVPRLLEGLRTLEYRGYDSAGIAIFSEKNSLTGIKSKGRIENLEAKLSYFPDASVSHCGIGHTRWATHGEPSDINSHPHGTPRVYIVHNGIIENYAELKDFLISQGYTFSSQTDTEAAALMIDYCYNLTQNPADAILSAVKRFKGSYAIGAVFSSEPGKIYAIRKDNPLIAAISSDGCFIASDLPAVLKYTDNYMRIDEGELAVVEQSGIKIYSPDKTEVKRDFKKAEWDVSCATKGEYPHFMLKEIHEEPTALFQTLYPIISDGMPNFDSAGLNDTRLKKFKKIYVVACGTAMHAGLVGKFIAEKMARVPLEVEIASEFRYKNPILDKTDMVIIISQSGETADSLAALRLAKQCGAYTLGVVNVPGSSVAREADGVIYTHAGPEIAVASTKAYTVQLGIMYLFAFRLAYAHEKMDSSQLRKYTQELITSVPELIHKILDTQSECAAISKKYKNAHSAFFIGRGLDYALSSEAALKLKEISYIHSEAYAAGELKHGTLSLVCEDTPVFAFAGCADLLDKTISNLREVRARGGKVVLICQQGFQVPSDSYDDILYLPSCDQMFTIFPAATIAQLIAYYTSLELGRDIDRPRNLAKSVTVE
ncbi:MAG: glutamine--fructose-6-phosphate transaminase (isomerizing) [Clostridia bacterium]|nr:glutamine--fructose-6-phosphate transaminase (isomerizing) [Clostridia bacterium]